jgi:hypothetical protein
LYKKTYTVVHPDNVSVGIASPIIEMCGALPLPSTLGATRNFVCAIESRCINDVIQIYPEAHVWPYYTGIRDFNSACLKYPIKFKKPIFVMTNTFTEKTVGKVPKVISYIDGPFYPNAELSLKQQEEDLKNIVKETMVSRAKNSNYKYYEYIKRRRRDD